MSSTSLLRRLEALERSALGLIPLRPIRVPHGYTKEWDAHILQRAAERLKWTSTPATLDDVDDADWPAVRRVALELIAERIEP
jgi:hypothetical protein